MNTQSSLIKLRELTHQLTLSDCVRADSPGWVRYETLKGSCIGVALLTERSVAVQKTFMSRGTIFPKHVHSETEIMIIFEGSLQIGKSILGPGDLVRFAPNEEHAAVALEDTWMIAVTVPACGAYPKRSMDGGQ